MRHLQELRPNAIILHGKPSKAKFESLDYPGPRLANWLSWVTVELNLAGMRTDVPEIPKPYEPAYAKWEAAFDGLPTGHQTTIIGHSFGAVALRWLAERPSTQVGQLVVVAPWLDPDHRYPQSDADFEIPDTLPGQCQRGIDVLYDPADGAGVLRSVERLHDALPESDAVRYRQMPGFGHFMTGDAMRGPEFPELLQVMGVDRAA